MLALEAAVNLISSSSATCLRVVSDDTLRALAGMVDAPQLHLASPDLRVPRTARSSLPMEQALEFPIQ